MLRASATPRKSPEQIARAAITAQFRASGWVFQDKDAIDFHAGEAQIVRRSNRRRRNRPPGRRLTRKVSAGRAKQYSLVFGPADNALLVDGQKVGVSEAKEEALGQTGTTELTLESLVVLRCAILEQQGIARFLDEQFEVIEQNERELDTALERSAALRQEILKKPSPVTSSLKTCPTNRPPISSPASARNARTHPISRSGVRHPSLDQHAND